MPELRAVLDRGVDTEHARLTDKDIVANADRAGVDQVRLRPITEQRAVAPDDRIVANRDEIRAHWNKPRLHHGAAADPGAEQAKIGVIEWAAGQQRHRGAANERLHQPETEVAQA